MNNDGSPVVSVKGLTKHFHLRASGSWWRAKEVLKAVDGVDFDVCRGKTFAVVGESGAGKTTVGLCVLGLLAPTAGTVSIDCKDLSQLKSGERRRLRLRMQSVFQDAYDALDPRMTVFEMVGEPLQIHHLAKGLELKHRIADLLHRVGLSMDLIGRLPRELSAGQRQRVSIARALALYPKLLVLDEPLAFLDVLSQERIVALLRTIQDDLGLSYLLITHDFSIVRALASNVAVMWRGKFVEVGTPVELFGSPRHPYTQMLMRSMPPPLVG